MSTTTLPRNGRAVNAKREGPVVKAVNRLAVRVDQLEAGGLPPRPAGKVSEDAQKFVDCVNRGTARLNDIEVRVQELEANRPTILTLKLPKRDTRKLDGVFHPVFCEVVELAHARDNIFLPGPSGSGKSHLAKQVAEALELRFGFISCSAGMSESQLLGRMVPAFPSWGYPHQPELACMAARRAMALAKSVRGGSSKRLARNDSNISNLAQDYPATAGLRSV